MNLAAELKTDFSASSRSRGGKLRNLVQFQGALADEPPHRVLIHEADRKQVWFDPSDLEACSCTCEEFDFLEPCHHLWATVLAYDRAAEEQGLEVGSHFGVSGFALSPETERVLRQVRLDPRFGAKGRTGRGGVPSPSERRLTKLLRRRETSGAQAVDHLAQRVRQLHLGLSPRPSAEAGCEVVVGMRTRRGSGRWGVWADPDQDLDDPDIEVSAADRALLARLRSAADGGGEDLDSLGGEWLHIPAAAIGEFTEELAKAQRLFGLPAADAPDTLSDPGFPIRLSSASPLRVRCEIRSRDDSLLALSAEMLAGDQVVPPADLCTVVGDSGLVIRDELHRFVTAFPLGLVRDLLGRGPLVVPASRRSELESLLQIPATPERVAPEECRIRLHDSLESKTHGHLVRGVMEFDYGSDTVAAGDRAGILGSDGARLQRDQDVEQAWLEQFADSGGILHWELDRPATSLPVADLVPCIERLLAAGFTIYAAHQRVRSLGAPRISVRTGIDWFDVELDRDEGNGVVDVPLPDLMRAIATQKSGYVRIGDGEIGLLGGVDLRVLTALSALGKTSEGAIQIPRSQGMLLDAMLETQYRDSVRVDEKFVSLRRQHAVKSVPRNEPKGFGATLRDYQREGLGWFRFLQKLGVGGCLADDMGLGKTVQVLALLEQQRRSRPHPGPSLVVAPRSLVFHWVREAQRFAPKLRVLPFVGAGRFETHGPAYAAGFAGTDLVITTYGSLRNDVARFEEVQWNYLVLDEAQAIKNPRSQISKAVRLCRGRHRLALSGTPIENHLGELWSLFEFLNPGMLGASRTFQSLLSAKGIGKILPGDSDEEAGDSNSFTTVLRKAVRPFLLRRTKEQVLTELPAKTEQVIECELPGKQRKAYDALAAHFRAEILGKVGKDKVPDKMRFQVLEALLRLRQVACHPGLVDPERKGEDCAKFDTLLPMLAELRDEGHKALVFSQFPSFLTLLRDRLDAEKVEYAYLDGKTRKRSAQVDRFQEDPDCGLFLISLKAGGHGLNLTAASYVFLLDPWWNPAVEAQAVDRSHRMGQRKKVHAYRLICRETVEERVADLQSTKRALADAVLGDDSSVLQGLTGADVAALLG